MGRKQGRSTTFKAVEALPSAAFFMMKDKS